jgi:hypothetical protein
MAYTVGSEALNMAGTYWMQPARQATILGGEHQRRPFIDNIKTALRKYEARNDTFPEHLIIFRGGASEGEFKKVGKTTFNEANKDNLGLNHNLFGGKISYFIHNLHISPKKNPKV